MRRGRGGLAVTGQLVFRRVELVSVAVTVVQLGGKFGGLRHQRHGTALT